MKKYFVLGAASIKAAVDRGSYPIDNTQVNIAQQSVVYDADTTFKPCQCDMTSNSCDAFCCCDTQCNQVSSSDFCTNLILGIRDGMADKPTMSRCNLLERH